MASWEYHERAALAEAVELLACYEGEAKVIAGGQSLLILLNERLLEPRALVALQRIQHLDGASIEDNALLIGANVTHQQVHTHPAVRAGWPLLVEAAGSVATMQVRNRGTLCGSLAHGFPLSDPPAALLALDAEARAVGPSGERTVPLEELFVGFLTTSLGPDEILAQVRVPPLPARSGAAYEVMRARPLDFPVVGVAARLTLAQDGRCAQARLALVGGGPTPLRARSAEALLEGEAVTAELIDGVARAVSAEAEPVADLDGSVGYKRRLLGGLARRALRRALAKQLPLPVGKGRGEGAS